MIKFSLSVKDGLNDMSKITFCVKLSQFAEKLQAQSKMELVCNFINWSNGEANLIQNMININMYVQ